MSLTFIKKPAVILTESPAEFKFKVDSALVTQGGYASVLIHFLVVPVTNDTIEIGFDGNTLTFVFQTPDGINPLKLSTFATPSAGMALLAQQLSAHPLLSKYYTVEEMPSTAFDGYLHIKARQRGAKYNLTIGGTYSIESDSHTINGATDVYADTHNLTIRAKDEDDNILNEIEVTGITNPDTNELNVTANDLPELLAAQLQLELPLQITLPYRNRAQRFLPLEAFETRNNTDRTAVQLGSFRVLRGGMPLQNHPANEVFTAFETYASGKKRFLTHQARTKMVTAEQPEWLSFYFDTAGTYTLKFTLYYTDATNTTSTSSYVVPEAGLYTIPTGLTQNSLAGVTPAKTIVKYQFEIVNAGSTIISEPMVYVVDTRFFRKQRYFVFVNSFGCPDTLRMVGAKESESKLTRSINESAVNSESRPRDGGLMMYYTELESTFTISTGYLESNAEVDYLNEFILSRNVAEVFAPFKYLSGGHHYLQPMRRVVLLTDKLRLYNDNDFTRGGEFAMQYARKDTTFSAYTAADEIYYDSEIRFTLVITSATPTSTLFNWSTNVGADYVCYINGELTALTSGNNTFDQKGTYEFVFKARGMTKFHFRFDNGTGKIGLTHYAADTVTDFKLSATTMHTPSILDGHHRFRFIQKWYTITNNGLDEVNGYLRWLATHQQKYGALTDVDLTINATTPTIYGAEAKAWLTADGVTVTTS